MQRTTPLKFGFGLVAMALLAGCAGQGHQYAQGVCITCVNPPLTGEPLNYDPDETPMQVAQNAEGETVGVQELGPQSGKVQIESPVDVDTAYARIKPAFGFRSPADFNHNDSNADWAMGDEAWQHQATPGAFYNLSDYGDQIVGGVEYGIVQKVQIQKSGAGSRIIYRWFPSGDNVYDGEAMKTAIRERLNAALQ
ncbi:hypothetical protein [Halomonas elongata]|uniref:Lipoprotein n=1 Tax=Halomonas elongata (strain ATCC 33173 / DSM 2581 / NBRC 15536 / NCIMB 2198 / 1H9) TaxID=768066 RepID=E1VA35_HALED|nr:hypothetical protein [Halomonas elongata]WBF17663.1 hypothetical protein LM502_16540 [Halomonas elongata]WPU46503.1 hypothetical protein SR933_14775 [Halomonas elongata DSM 2581]CBV43923.1 uncharacterized protein HELO_4039 [Halomonas elongata DSM 2581]